MEQQIQTLKELICKQIKDHRTAMGLTQRQMADKLDVVELTYARVENGKLSVEKTYEYLKQVERLYDNTQIQSKA